MLIQPFRCASHSASKSHVMQLNQITRAGGPDAMISGNRSRTRRNEGRLRWRTHRDIVVESQLLLDSLTAGGTQDAEDLFLLDLREADGRLRTVLEALASGNALPSDAHLTKFQKAAHILEEAVRGFTIEAHGNFWTGIDRERFVNLHMFNSPFLARDAGR
jgi:hypothetical protein